MSRASPIAMAVFGAAAGACLFALPAQAQNVADTLPAPAAATSAGLLKPICFRGHAPPTCKTFLITEVAYHLHEAPDGRGANAYLSWSYGFMVNLSGRDAVGATRTLIALDNGPSSSGRTAWLLRYRRWIAQEGIGLDLALGRVSTADDDLLRGRYIGEVGMSLGDYLGVFGQSSGSPEGPQPNGGFKLGSWPGLVLGAASLYLYLIIPPS
jgi:hypothetical protein